MKCIKSLVSLVAAVVLTASFVCCNHSVATETLESENPGVEEPKVENPKAEDPKVEEPEDDSDEIYEPEDDDIQFPDCKAYEILTDEQWNYWYKGNSSVLNNKDYRLVDSTNNVELFLKENLTGFSIGTNDNEITTEAILMNTEDLYLLENIDYYYSESVNEEYDEEDRENFKKSYESTLLEFLDKPIYMVGKKESSGGYSTYKIRVAVLFGCSIIDIDKGLTYKSKDYAINMLIYYGFSQKGDAMTNIEYQFYQETK